MTLRNKKLLTAVLFAFGLTGVFFVLATSLISGVVAARMSIEQQARGLEGVGIGLRAQSQVVQLYGPKVLVYSAIVAILLGAGLAFGGVLPWCRPPRLPPPLPPGLG